MPLASPFPDVPTRRGAAATHPGLPALPPPLVDVACRYVAETPDGICQADTAGRAVYVNQAMADLLGYRPEELIGVDVWALIHPEDVPQARVLWERRMRGLSDRSERRLRRKDGTYVHTEAASSPIRAADGAIIGVFAAFRDLTERKRLERELREQRALAERELAELDSLYRSAPVGLALIDRELRYVRINDTLAAANGHSADEHIGRTVREMVPALADAVEPVYRVVFETGQSIHGQEINGPTEAGHGAERTWLTHYHPVNDAAGAVVAVSIVVHEITATRRLEKAVLMREERLHAALAASHTGTFRWNITTDELWWDSSLCRLFGLTPGTGSLTLADFIARVHPDDREAVTRACDAARRQDGELDLDFRVVLPDGAVRWLRDRGRVVPSHEGGAPYMVGACTDITERQVAHARVVELESQQRAMLDHLPIGIWFLNAAGQIVYGNPAGQEVWRGARYIGLEQLGEYVAWWHDTGIRIQPHEWAGAVACRERKRLIDQLIDIQCFDGSRKTILNSAVPIELPDGSLRGVVIFNLDVTEQTRTRAELERSHEELEQRVTDRTAKLQETIGELEAFSYSVSHDIRAPLRSMQGFSAILLKEHAHRLDESGRDLLQRVHRAALRLEALSRDILAYTRIGRDQLDLQPVDLDQLISDLVEESAALKPPRAQVSVRSPLGSVRGHPALVSQIFANLLGNAAKFVPPGTEPRITVSAECGEGWRRVTVTDNGIGIEARHFGAIFEIFGRVHGEASYEGTGIGLAIVKKAVQRLGGEVSVESDVGRGSRFIVSLRNAP